jgi:sRNA-binding protein
MGWFTAMQMRNYARLAVEQATADLRGQLAAMTRRANDEYLAASAHRNWAELQRIRAEKVEAERDEARAELARLTTLRPASEHDPNEDGYARWFFHKDDYWAEVGSDHRKPQYATHWTPLPPVKEADK